MMQASLFDTPPEDAEWDKDSWCTPPEVMEAVHRFWPGGIDLDPCSNHWAKALGFVRAKVAWTKADDCMAQPTWPGATCWLQPPYSREGAPIIGCPDKSKPLYQGSFLRRWDAGDLREALVLIRLDTSTDNWEALANRSTSLVHFKKRLDHYEAGERKGGSNICSAMLLLTRNDPKVRHRALEAAIGDLGWVYR